MIKTISYNDFSKYDRVSTHKVDFMMEEMRQFVANGGDLNLDVFTIDEKIVKFVDFIKDSFHDSYTYVLEEILINKWIDNPFDFVIEDNYIKENTRYNLKWLSNYSNNYKDVFGKLILEALEKLAKDTNSINLEYYLSIEGDGETSRVNKIHSPLFYIAGKLEHKPEIWNIFLKYNPQIKEYMKDYLKTPLKMERFFDIKNDHINNSELANVFYKHGIISAHLEKNQNSSYELISSAIQTMDLEVLTQLSKSFKFSEIEKTQEVNGAFISMAQDPEIAKLLLDNDCFFAGKWQGEKADKEFYISTHTQINPETLDTILSHPKVKAISLIEKNTDAFYHKFFVSDNKNNKIKNIKLLVEKYQFPLQHAEMLQIAHREDEMKWFIKHGADPRQCEEFINKIIASRDKSPLSRYKKEGLLDPLSPDMLYAGSKSTSTTKTFSDYFGKANAEQWSYLTKEGLPAWWGIADPGLFSSAKYNITNYNQLSSKGQSWIFHLTNQIGSRNGLSNSTVVSRLKTAQAHLKRHQEEKIIGIYKEGEATNFLHNIFKTQEYGKDSVDHDLVNFVFENVEANFKALINQPNEKGIYPLEYFFSKDSKGNKFINNSNTKIALKEVIKHMEGDFPFEQMIKGKSVLDLVKEECQPDDYKLAYASFIQNKMSKQLPEKETKSPGIKL